MPLVSLFGYVMILAIAWLLSSHRFRVPVRILVFGSVLQFVLAMLILRTSPGSALFAGIGQLFTELLNFVDAGASFVFGPGFKDFYFAFKVLPTIVFVSALTSMLYYLGIMQIVVQSLAKVLQWTLGTSAAETLSASANIFMGQTEAPLLVKPYIAKMTLSELNAVMVGGFSTIAGSVLAAFVGLGIDAGHLVTASVISAPASLMIAKLMLPEVDQPATLGATTIAVPRPGVNLIEAAAIGATEGMKLALNVAAMLLVFLSLVAMFDKAIAVVGEQFSMEWSLRGGLGYAFAPLAWLMGIEWKDCWHAGQLLGLKMATTEFVAYEEFSRWLKPESTVHLQPRTVVIMTYALCGFSNFASIGIQIGGLGAMAPERQSDLARLGLRAMIGGTLVCCLTACVAGVLI
ncbi:MAG: NupC/NupG family nucleoside CNT transporter [Planctomycetes bacterium]|nr:NupC/NupG family nucleoside CNT transporter [Planctomycetota bacterium]